MIVIGSFFSVIFPIFPLLPHIFQQILLDGDKRDRKLEDRLSGELYDTELATGVLISPIA